MAEILILGAGAMGSAFSFPLADAGHGVRLVGTHLDRERINCIHETGFHPRLKMKLPQAVAPFTHDQLSEALSPTIDLIVLGVSSAGVDWAVRQLGPLMKTPTPILMLTKGLKVTRDTLAIIPDTVREGLAGYGIEGIPIGAVGGPCIAGELAARRDTSVVIACSDAVLLDRMVHLVSGPYYHARPSMDIIGVEACAAFKNLYAIGVGYSAGLLFKVGTAPNAALMHNLAASLFTQALAEINYIVNFMGGASATVSGLAGTGDLYVTCQAGRNSRMGYLLGTGMRYREAKASHMADDTVEGAELALALGPTLDCLNGPRPLPLSALPLAAAIVDAIYHDIPTQIPWTSFHQNLD